MDLFSGKNEAEEAHDHEQEAEDLVMTADDVFDIGPADDPGYQ